jgi:probable O-glycosylation ligase (exosortase A-associated)
MRDLAIILLVFGILPFTLTRPFVGILLWSWLGYMNPHRLTWGFAYDFPFAQLAAVACLFAVMFSRERLFFSPAAPRFPWCGTTMLWLGFLVWITFTSMFAINEDWAWSGWERAMKIQLFALLTLCYFQTRERLTALLWVIVLSLGFFGVKGGLFTILNTSGGLVWGPAGSYIEGNNELGLTLVMIVPLAWHLMHYETNRWLRLSLVVTMIMSFASMLGTYSRGCVLAAAAMVGFMALKSRHRLKFSLIVVALLPLMIVNVPDEWIQRVESIGNYEEDGSAMNRIWAWQHAIDIANARPLGGGIDFTSEQAYQRFSPAIAEKIETTTGKFSGPHSIFFKVLGEHGWAGLVVYLLLGWSVYRCGSDVIRMTANRPELMWERDLASMLQVSLVGFIVGGAFLGLTYFDLPWHLAGMLVILRFMLQQRGVPVSRASRARPITEIVGSARATPQA